jgi:hypothetical protein
MTKTKLQEHLFSRLCNYFKSFDLYFKYSDKLDLKRPDDDTLYKLKRKYYLLYNSNHEYIGWKYPNLKTMLLPSLNYFSIFEYNYKVMDPRKKYYEIFEPLKQLKSSCLEELVMKMDLMGI